MTSSPAVVAPDAAKYLTIAITVYVLFVLLGYSFADREIWSDEAASLMLIGGHDPAAIVPGRYTPDMLGALYDPAPTVPLEDIWKRAAARDNHTPSYVFLFAALLTMFDGLPPDVPTIRYLNIALTGLFIFPAVGLVREFGIRPGWLTAAIIVLSPYAFYVAREIRPYGLLLVFTLLAVWLVLRVRRLTDTIGLG